MLSILSALACLVLAVMWARSQRVGDCVETWSRFSSEPGYVASYYLLSRQGLLVYENTWRVHTPLSEKGYLRHWHSKPRFRYTRFERFEPMTVPVQTAVDDPPQSAMNRLGFYHRRTEWGAWAGRTVAGPYWLLVALTAIAPYRRARRRVAAYRARRRTKLGLCPSCGYDLRATPGRCPECGHGGGAAGAATSAVL